MRILFISPTRPSPCYSGGEQRTKLLYRALSSVGTVDLVILSPEPVFNREELRRDYGLIADFVQPRLGSVRPFRWFLKWRPELVHKVAKFLLPRSFDYHPEPAIGAEIRALIAKGQYDLIVGRYLRTTIKSGVIGSGVPIALDIDDLDTQSLLSRLNAPGRPFWERWIWRRHYRQTKKIIPAYLRKFDLVWVTNEESDTAGEELKEVRNKIHLPNIPAQAAEHPLDENAPLPPFPLSDAPSVILFVANFYHEPNRLGTEHFLRHIWPKIRAEEPAAIFRIVGQGLNDALRDLWNAMPNVEAIGFVEDLAASYAQCRFTVAPLLSGAGTNMKVLESLYFGRTCVLNEFSHRGFARTLRHEQEILIANSDAAFADACIRLLREPDTCHTLASQGRTAVARQHSFEAFRQVVADSIDNILAAV